jgi:pimeloyl-ACP methyl ester carboxylesterase
VVHWDYRGHGSSDVARDGDYAMQTQAEDLRCVTEAVMARGRTPGPPLQVAFSMGVAVLLELYRNRPELVPAMALIAGTPDAPWSHSWAFALPGARSALRASLAALQPLVPLMAPVVHRLITSPLAYPTGRVIGLLRPRAPREDIEVMMRSLRAMDPLAYWKTLRELMKARTSDVLPRVTVPVLIIAASHDVLAPASAVEEMRDALPHARWLRVDDAGHAGLLEAGAQVAEALQGFIQEMDEALSEVKDRADVH